MFIKTFLYVHLYIYLHIFWDSTVHTCMLLSLYISYSHAPNFRFVTTWSTVMWLLKLAGKTWSMLWSSDTIMEWFEPFTPMWLIYQSESYLLRMRQENHRSTWNAFKAAEKILDEPQKNNRFTMHWCNRAWIFHREGTYGPSALQWLGGRQDC